jgi:hypothetical protein
VAIECKQNQFGKWIPQKRPCYFKWVAPGYLYADAQKTASAKKDKPLFDISGDLL